MILPEDMFRMYWDTLLLVLTLWCAAAALLGAHPAHICTGTGLRRYAFSVPFEMVFLPDDYHAPFGMKALEYSALPPPARSSAADTTAVGTCWSHPCRRWHLNANRRAIPEHIGRAGSPGADVAG